jgi:cobalt-zinc-cadmium efflux system outer membrane protein
MRMGCDTIAVCAVACLYATAAAAQSRTLTLADVLARAREQAPQIASARLALDETRARLVGASLRFQSNPQIEGALGNRNGSASRFTDFELGLGQSFEPGARRSARVAGAEAAIAQSAANLDEVTRFVLRGAASAYYRALHAANRVRLLDAASQVAAGVASTADRRFRAGDIAVLDVNIAKSSLARVRADREAAEAVRAQALGDLRQLLGLDAEAGVDGTLTPPTDADLPTALRTALQRPELRALEAAVQEAEADVRLGLSFSKPEYGVGLRYSREEGDQIVLGGLTVTLPMFSKGQEQRAAGSARAARQRADLEAARARVQIEVRTAFNALGRRLAALRVLEADAMQGLDENEQLATRSFEVGQLALSELLLIRRELLDTRFHYLDALLEAALAKVDLDASAAILR